MAQQALGIMRMGKTVSLAVISRSYKQSVLKFSQTYSLNTDDDAEAKDRMITILRDLSNEQKLSKVRVAFGLDSRSFMWNVVDMPPVSKEDMRQILEFELDSHLPIDPDNVVFDTQNLDETPGLDSRVGLVAASRDIYESYREIAAKVDIELDSISPASMVILQTIKNNRTVKPGVNIVLMAQGDQYEVIATIDGHFISSRIVGFGNPWKSDKFEESDTETLQDDVPSLILKNIQLVLLACNRACSLDTLEEITCVGKFDEIVLSELKERMQQTEFTAFYLDKLCPPESSYQEIAAVSLAMDLFSEYEGLNLIPPAARPVRRDVGRIMIGAAAGLLVAAMILVGANSFWKTELNLASTDARLASLEHLVNQIIDINQRYSVSQDARNFFMSKSVNYPSHLDILLEVTRLLPAEDTETTKKVWLENYELENHLLMIRGDSDSPEGLLTALEESPYFEKVKFDGTVSGTRFTIKAVVSKIVEVTESPETDLPDESGKENAAVGSPLAEDMQSGSDVDVSDKNSSKEEGKGDPETIPEEEKETLRGPAFPKTKPAEVNAGEEEMQHVDPLSPEEQEKLDNQIKEEDMEAMKDNLFKFIKERKESGDIDPAEHRNYENQDPDETAANFLEFLKAAAENGEGAN